MNSFEMALPLVPLVKYEPQFATAIGKWMLNNASATRLFYPGNIADENQFLPHLKHLTKNNIGYEGIKYTDRYGKYSATPIAEGDGPSWTKDNPEETMFSLYSSSPVGIFGAIIGKTDVEGILKLDCNATDFYSERPYPVYLIYNPYKEEKIITYTVPKDSDLFNIIKNDYLARGVSGSTKISIPARQAIVITELPAGAELNTKDGKIVAERKYIISY